MKISTFPQYYFMLLFKGLGLGIIYLPRLDCITQYFDKKRPLVTGRSTSMHTQSFGVNIIKKLSAYQRKFYNFVSGIAICGSGIGTFIFAPLTDW